MDKDIVMGIVDESDDALCAPGDDKGRPRRYLKQEVRMLGAIQMFGLEMYNQKQQEFQTYTQAPPILPMLHAYGY